MDFDIDKIFLPSTGVDMVFNMNSLTPYFRSSIIYDTDYGNNTITVAQAFIPVSSSTVFKELHLTTIINDKKRKIRVGVKCNHLKVIKQYPLANKKTVPAILLSYELPIKETNIRSAFRLFLNKRYTIKAKILYNNIEFITSKDFFIKDISLAGMGIIIPKKRDKALNPLAEIKINNKVTVDIILIGMDKDKPAGTIPLKAQVTRLHPTYSNTQLLAGLKINNLTSDNERILNKFIHDAQIADLKRLSRLDL
ncbi:MAG: PilZ domain-containing protein [Desulfobacteraceae bacterium]|nr:PilZ domain-containing protein [Desulfobacteraceae bacterium]